MTALAVLASACLPFPFQAVEIGGEHYWDGGYVGNPAIYPLNSSLMRELRAISFVTWLIEDSKIARGEMKQMLIHSIRSDETMTALGVSSKLNAEFLCFLHDKGRAQADA